MKEKLEVYKEKAKLKHRREWITDDITERERKIEWWIRMEAERNRREGKKVRMDYMKLWIENKLWVWDEMKDKLKEWQIKRDKKEGEGGEREKKEKKNKQVF